MGGYPTDFSWAGKNDPLLFALVIIVAFITVYIIYKLYLYLMDRRKWGWYFQLCKEKQLIPREVAYLKSIVVKKKFADESDLFQSIYSLNLPTPIRKKLLSDNQLPKSADRLPGHKQK